jgi:lysozyme
VAAAIVGAAGLSLTMTSEGKVNRVYRDPVGILTACYGHTGPELRMGQTFTDAQCQALLRADLASHQAYVRSGSPRNCISNVLLNQNQLDAVTDFVFNVGPTAFCKSTLAARLRLRDYPGAAAQFPKWVYARKNGQAVRLPGLVIRRDRERRLFLTSVNA